MPAPPHHLPRKGVYLHHAGGLASLLALTVLVGCGGGSGSSGTATTSNSAAASPASGGGGSAQLTLAVPSISANTDPQQHDGPGNAYWVVQTAGTLVVPKRVPADSQTLPPAGDVSPGLATSWTTGKNGITFKLRAAKSQYGNPLTAADVKWSLARIDAVKDPVSPGFAAAGGIDLAKGVAVVDPSTVRVNGTPNPLMLSVLAYKGFNVYDAVEAKKHATSSDPYAKKWLALNTATFGPYSTSSFTPNQEMRLTANPNYYGAKPHFTNVVIRAVTSSSTALQLLKSGSVDFASGLNVNDFSSLKGNPGFETPTFASVSSACVCFTTNKGPTANRDLRQAISLALDRQAIIDGPFKGLANLPRGFVSAGTEQKTPPEPFEENLEKAKTLVKKSGVTGPVTLGYADIGLTGIGVDVSSIAVLVQAQLRKAGIEVKLVKKSDAEYFPDAIKHQFDMFFDLVGGGIADKAYALNLTYGKTGFLNFQGYANPAVDKLLTSAFSATGAERDAQAAKAEAMIRADAPAAIIAEPRHYAAFKKGLTGLGPAAGEIDYLQYLAGS